ncbi:MAG: alpha/beta hydrolase [Coleofasciculaceae cyanobacterium SM2_1_6]|nr:alpha/beta hydrolase [Coleofasciculaceae cyanobacterium SM2_1_6]
MVNSLHIQIRGQGTPILCLHGHPGNSQAMDVFTDHLSQNYQTISPDLRGYGKSKPGGNFQMLDHLEDLTQLLDQQGIGECLILGWSLGGILGLELALQLPQRVKGLILVATAARPRGSHPAISWQDNLYTGMAALINLVSPGWQWNIDTFGKRSLFRYLIQQHTPESYQWIAKAAVPAYLQTTPEANQALHKALRQGYNRLPQLADLTCPCLVLAGADDRHITSASSLETAEHLPQSQSHCYPQTAHLFPWEIAPVVLRDIDQWLAANFPKI